MRAYLACFDIEDDRNRRKLSNLLLSYGDRVQYSVFEISVRDEAELEKLCKKCQRYTETTDSLRFYWLPKDARQGSRNVQGKAIASFPAAVIL